MENERSGIVVGETEIARVRQKRSEKERKQSGEARVAVEEKEKEAATPGKREGR